MINQPLDGADVASHEDEWAPGVRGRSQGAFVMFLTDLLDRILEPLDVLELLPQKPRDLSLMARRNVRCGLSLSYCCWVVFLALLFV